MSLNPQNLAPGQEQYEIFTAAGRAGKSGPRRCQYDYRHHNGELFSCITASLRQARTERDDWLRKFTMLDDEYAIERESGMYVCPTCRSRKVEEREPLQWSDPGSHEELAHVRLACNDCGMRWTEILRPVGYEPE